MTRNNNSIAIGFFYLLLFAGVLFLQLFILQKDTSIGDEDAAAYALQGHNIAAGNGLVSPVVGLHFKNYAKVEHTEDYWPPMQSVLIAFSRIVFGKSIFADKLPNVIGYFILIICIGFIANKFFGFQAALLASLMSLFAADIALYSLGCRNDLWYVLFLLVCLYFLSGIGPHQHGRIKNASIAGIIAGLAYLQRPISLLLVPTITLMVFLDVISTWSSLKHALERIKHWIAPVIVFTILFAAVASPFTIRNYRLFGSPFPDMPSIWGAVIMRTHMNHPYSRNAEHIDGNLTQFSEMRSVAGDDVPHINFNSSQQRRAFINKGLRELEITLLIIKRSLIIEFSFLLLTAFSFFLVQGKTGNFLRLFFIYFALSVIIIPFYMHTEQRYFIFIIPFICIFSAFMLFELEKMLIHRPSQRTVYWCLIAGLLASLFLIPIVKLYQSNINRIYGKNPLAALGQWVNDQSEAGAVIMSTAPYRMSYYSQRPVVMLPDTSADIINNLCRHYGVFMVVAPAAETDRLESYRTEDNAIQPFTSISAIQGYGIFSYKSPIILSPDSTHSKAME
jgi:4-amino-4-deoxy-L-arabinose transferase-like glycosyltransferase